MTEMPAWIWKYYKDENNSVTCKWGHRYSNSLSLQDLKSHLYKHDITELSKHPESEYILENYTLLR